MRGTDGIPVQALLPVRFFRHPQELAGLGYDAFPQALAHLVEFLPRPGFPSRDGQPQLRQFRPNLLQFRPSIFSAKDSKHSGSDWEFA